MGDGTVLIESTGTRPSRVAEAVGLLSLVFASRGWEVAPVAIRARGAVDPGRSYVDPRSVGLRATTLESVAGRSSPASEVAHLLSKARLSARPATHGWSVEVPPWRPDLIQEVDLVEEVVLARGVKAEDGAVPPSPTRGRRRAESRFQRRVGELLIGSGFSELYTPVLVSEAAVARLNRVASLRVTNPVSDLFERLRDAIELSLVDALAHNLRAGYPQRFFEFGPVVVGDPKSETGARTSVHAGGVIAAERAGLARCRVPGRLHDERVRGAGVREPTELPGTIPGRAPGFAWPGRRSRSWGRSTRRSSPRSTSRFRSRGSSLTSARSGLSCGGPRRPNKAPGTCGPMGGRRANDPARRRWESEARARLGERADRVGSRSPSGRRRIRAGTSSSRSVSPASSPTRAVSSRRCTEGGCGRAVSIRGSATPRRPTGGSTIS